MIINIFWNWIKSPAGQRVLLFISMSAIFLFFFQTCAKNRRLEEELQKKSNNIVALQDTVRIERTRSGELQQVKTVLIIDIKELKAINAELYKEVKDQNQKVYYISKLTTELADKLKNWSPGGEHTFNPVTGTDDISWSFDTIGIDWSRKLSGKTSFKVTSDCDGYKIEPKGSFLENINYKFSLVTGLKKSESHKGSLEIFVKSTYPGMMFTDIQGSIVNPEDLKEYLSSSKIKKWSIGPYFGIGYGVTLEKTPQLLPVLNIGIGVQYKLLSF